MDIQKLLSFAAIMPSVKGFFQQFCGIPVPLIITGA
jgi:hypothetical protein